MWHPPVRARYALTLLASLFLSHLSNAHSTDISQPTTDRWLSKRQRQWVSRGLQIIPDTCTGAQLTAVQNAILDASYLAGAGLNAAANFTELPFRYFFQDDLKTANKVAGVYRRVQSSQQGHGELIGVTCQDHYASCKADDHGSITPAYSGQAVGRAPLIVFCPPGFALPRNPVPCTKSPGTISLGWVMLHEMSHIHSISGPELHVSDTTGDTARDVNDALDDGTDTTLDANSYAYLGSWAWDLGLGGPPWNQQKTCLGKFRRGNFDEVLGDW